VTHLGEEHQQRADAIGMANARNQFAIGLIAIRSSGAYRAIVEAGPA